MLIANHNPSVDGPHITMRGEVLEVRAEPADVYQLLSLYLQLAEHQTLCRVVHDGWRHRLAETDQHPSTARPSGHESWCEVDDGERPHDCLTQITDVDNGDEVFTYLTQEPATGRSQVAFNIGNWSLDLSPEEAGTLADVITQHGDAVVTELRRLSALAGTVRA